jgi:hypothetical protein
VHQRQHAESRQQHHQTFEEFNRGDGTEGAQLSRVRIF